MIDYIQEIQQIAKKLNKNIKIMEVCGGHTNTIIKHGIRDILPPNIQLISGPGCPVCVTPQEDIDAIIELAINGVKIAIYGDMLNVKGSKMSINNAIENGCDIKIIYTTTQLNENDKDRVFFAIGFETTTPMTAYLLEKGFTIYSSHKIMLPPMKILKEQNNIDGYILPGHVSCIIGSETWKELNIAQVICGFEKKQIIQALYKLIEMIKNNQKDLINDYSEIVSKTGNLIAKKNIKKHFKIVDSNWRGIGLIKNSGLEPINDNLNAKIKYSHLLKNIKSYENKNCICSQILKGENEPINCKLFKSHCTPQNPIGACMVSNEGICNIAYKYLSK